MAAIGLWRWWEEGNEGGQGGERKVRCLEGEKEMTIFLWWVKTALYLLQDGKRVQNSVVVEESQLCPRRLAIFASFFLSVPHL